MMCKMHNEIGTNTVEKRLRRGIKYATIAKREVDRVKNIPMFTTQYGVASLILAEIPYRGEAYVHVQSTQNPDELIQECVGFCRAAGADFIYAKGHPYLENYPLHTAILKMTCPRSRLPKAQAQLQSVTEETVKLWQDLYNARMRDVDNSAWMTAAESKQMLQNQDGYFIYDGQTLLGIGRAAGDEIIALASAKRGAGSQIVPALAGVLDAETVWLQVAGTNSRAVDLYKKLGFAVEKEISRWYKIFPG